MVENSEKQAEMAKAVLEALGSGGIDGLKRMLNKFEAPRSESEKASGTGAANFMHLQQATPELLQQERSTPKPVKPVKQEKGLQLAITDRPSRTVESPAPLHEAVWLHGSQPACDPWRQRRFPPQKDC